MIMTIMVTMTLLHGHYHLFQIQEDKAVLQGHWDCYLQLLIVRKLDEKTEAMQRPS